MLLCCDAVYIPLQDPWCIPTHVVFRFRDRAACKGLGGGRCRNGEAPGVCPVVCARDDLDGVAGEDGTGSMVGCVAAVVDWQTNFVSYVLGAIFMVIAGPRRLILPIVNETKLLAFIVLQFDSEISILVLHRSLVGNQSKPVIQSSHKNVHFI